MNSKFVAICSLVHIGSALLSKKKCDNSTDENCKEPQYGKCTDSGADTYYCVCQTTSANCQDWEEFNQDDCTCNAKPCDPCEFPDDMDQTGQPDCACTLKTGVDPCDAKFGGKFKKADGSDCPAVDDGDNTDDGDEDSK